MIEVSESSRPISVICLDIEGGHGGSSRSLFHVLRCLESRRVSPYVFTRRSGPVLQRYSHHGISAEFAPAMPKLTVLARHNLIFALIFLKRWLQAGPFFDRVKTVARDRGANLIHLNHESLFLTGRRLKRQLDLPVVAHVRTMPRVTTWAVWQYRTLEAIADQLVFITENEREHYRHLVKRYDAAKQHVLYNPGGATEADPSWEPQPGQFAVVSLANFSPAKGLERLLDIAQELALMGETKVRFIMCGDMVRPGWRPRPSFQQLAAARRLEDRFVFLGHRDDPEAVLAGCHALIQLHPAADPWGRDIIEALSLGKPVLALGTYDRFVEDGANGYLFEQHNPKRIAEALMELSRDPSMQQEISERNRAKAARLFSAPDRAARLEEIYRKASSLAAALLQSVALP